MIGLSLSLMFADIMSVLEWKKLNFFRLMSNADNGKIKSTIKACVTACVSNSLHKVFCDSSGYVHIFYRNWDSLSFRACRSAIKYSCLTNENNSLCTLSCEENVNQVLIKLWDMNTTSKRNGALCIGSAVISARTAASAVNVSYKNSFYCIVIGFDGGEISIFRGTINRDFSNGFRNFQICARRITGIRFNQNVIKHIEMFVCSDSGIFLFNLTENNDLREAQVTLDKTESTGCSALEAIGLENPYFIVGRDDAVYFYTTEGKGPCYAIEGKKEYIARFSNYLVIVIFQKNSPITLKRKYLLIIVDIYHKIIVLHKDMVCLSGLLIEDKTCLVLTDTNEVITLYERDINYKLELLLQNYLFDISLSMLKQEYHEKRKLAKVYELYGDHLYAKGEYTGAIKKYVKTIGYLEPYNVIQKFLDSKLVSYLSEYMEAIIRTDNATEDHRMLFMNCKSRLSLPNKLREFLCGKDLDRNSNKDIYCSISETMTDSNHLIKTINETYNTSLEKFLRIINNTSEVQMFLKQLHEHQIYEFFKEHSQILMNSYIQQTTEIFKSICIYYFKTCHNGALAYPEIFIPLFMDQQIFRIDFLEYIINFVPNCTKIFYNCLFESYLRSWKCNKSILQKLLEFLNLHYDKLDENHFLILCKLYSFWEGVIIFFNKNSLNDLSVRYYVETEDSNKIASCHYISKSQHCRQYLNCLDATCENSITIVNFILNENLKKKMKSLQIFQRISKDKQVRVSQVQEFFINELLKLAVEANSDLSIINNMNHNVKQIRNTLISFSKFPMEIRFNLCNICNQHMNNPAAIFLCQHIFHKHCLNFYTEDNQNCVICNGNWNEKQNNDTSESNVLRLNAGFLIHIEKCIKNGILHNCVMKKIDLDRPLSNNPFESSESILLNQESSIIRSSKQNNPFETGDFYNKRDNYDANLNPFEE